MIEAGGPSRRTVLRALMGAAGAGAGWLAGCARHDGAQAGSGRVASGKIAPDTIAPNTIAPDKDYVGPGSLRVHAAAHRLLSGCAVNVRALASDAAYAELVRGQSSILVAENEMKWERLRPTIDTYDFERADALVAFAEKHHIKVRGHNLCWHRQLPKWFAGAATAANARQLLTDHIDRVAGRYAGRMHSWDVVNEAVLVSDGRGDGLRESPWLTLMGPEYVEVAFRRAREADPAALLCYNDYGVEGEDAEAQAKRTAVLLLLRRMKARQVPVDAVGIQSHLSAGPKHVYGAGLARFLAELRELGLQVFVTEMDVNDRELGADVAMRDQAVAKVYGDYLGLVLRDPAVRVVMTWGITDKRTWLNSEGARKDHLKERCLPFDEEMRPKAAFYAVRGAMDGRG